MQKRRRGRELVLRLLFGWSVQGGDIRDINQDFWKTNQSKEDIRQFSERLAFGTVSHIEEIDKLIVRFSSHWNIDRINLVDKNIIRIAIYEFLYADDIPCVVTINEAVEISKRYGADDSGSFVNGILDKVMVSSRCQDKKDKRGSRKK